MSKPKNLTPEQEAAWKEKQRLRRSSPEYVAKAKIRSRRWYEKEGVKEQVVAKTSERRADPQYRAHRNELERSRLASDQSLRTKASARQKAWAATPEGEEKSRLKSLRYYQSRADIIKEKRRLQRQFDRFMARLAAGEDVYGIGEAAE